ncbi:energy transducer TonB [Frateuria sp. GZRe12]|uniref:energy transducer TonB n=1 Tax=Frateuria sp. GZRe12 TaxID=3351533 RepID=UPI003EDB7174
MHRLSMVVAAWLLAVTGAVAQDVVREQPVSLQLDIDTQGQVAAVKVMDPQPFLMPNFGRQILQAPPYGPLPPVLKQAAVQVASKWRFQPTRVSGKPVTGRTWAQATLEIVKHEDGNFGVTLRYLRNGPYMEMRTIKGTEAIKAG